MAVVLCRFGLTVACLYLLTFNEKSTFAQDVVDLTAIGTFSTSHELMDGMISCRCSPPNAVYSYIRWYFSEIDDYNTAETVYHYTVSTSEARGRLTGRANHTINSSTGLLTLYIQNSNRTTDNGTFYCQFVGARDLHVGTQYYVYSNALLRNDNWTNLNETGTVLDFDSNLTATAWHECNDPPVTMEFTMIDNATKQVIGKENKTVTSSTGCSDSTMRDSEIEYQITNIRKSFMLNLASYHSSYENGVFQSGSYDIEVRPSACDSSPCQNGGTCQNMVDGFNCNCPVGYSGTRCENGACDSNPCQNGGTCQNTVDGFNCNCRMGYSGTKCENSKFRIGPQKAVKNGFTSVGALLLISGACSLLFSLYKCTETKGSPGDKKADQNSGELQQSCLEKCPCCKCCLDSCPGCECCVESCCCKCCFERCACCEYCSKNCPCLAKFLCLDDCFKTCPWCQCRIFGIIFGSFAVLTGTIILIVIHTL